MIQWVHFLDFEILGKTDFETLTKTKKPKNYCVVICLCIVGYSYIIFPVLTLLLWGVFMFNNAAKDGKTLD